MDLGDLRQEVVLCVFVRNRTLSLAATNVAGTRAVGDAETGRQGGSLDAGDLGVVRRGKKFLCNIEPGIDRYTEVAETAGADIQVRDGCWINCVIVADRKGVGVIRLGATILADARAEWVARQIRQLPITVAAKNMAFTVDLVIYAGNVFVAIPAQPGRLYEVVDYLCVVGWIRKQTQQKIGSRIDTTCRDDVAGKLRARASAVRRASGNYREWVEDPWKSRIGEIAPAFCKRRNRGREHRPLAQSEPFPTEKEEKLVFERRAAQGCSVLILGERWALDPGRVGKKLVRVQNLVAKELVRRAVPFVASRPGAEVDDTAGEFAPFRTHIVVLDFEFSDRILGRNDERQVDIADIERLAVQIFRALVPKGAAHLKISEVEGVLADGRAIGVSLRNHGGSDEGEIKNVAPVQGQLRGLALVDNFAKRGGFRLQQRSFAGHLDSLRDITHLQRCVDARTLVDLDDHLWSSEVLETSFLYLDLVPARKQVHK